MTPEQEQKLNEMYAFIQSLKNTTTIPLEIDQSFKSRFASSFGLTASSKGATSENKTVNESGASTYPVLNPPDLFLQKTIKGVTYYIPTYT